MVIAIGVSLTVFGSVLFAWAAMSREVGNAYASTEPASATLLFEKPIAEDQMTVVAAGVRTRPGVLDATGRTQFTGDVEVNGRRRDIPLQVLVAPADDPMRVAKFYVQRRTWPAAADEIFIARDSLRMLEVAVGDRVTVITPRGQRLALRVAATVYDPSLSPSEQEKTARAYVSTTALATGSRPALLDQLKIQVADQGKMAPSRNRDTVVA